jgi:hypothetical protein
MRIRPECVRDFDEDVECTTRHEPIREPEFYPRRSDCGPRFRRLPFTPQVPTYLSDEWPFFTFDKPNIKTEVTEPNAYEIDLGLNFCHDRRLSAARNLGQAIVAQLDPVDSKSGLL